MLLTFEQFKKQTDPDSIPHYFFYKTYDKELSYQMAYRAYLNTAIPHTWIRSRDYSEAEISELFRIFEETGE